MRVPVRSHRGDASDLIDAGVVVGRALRTQDRIRPVYVSVGHRVALDAACHWILALSPRYRQPEVIRAADHLARTTLAALGRAESGAQRRPGS